MILLFLLVKVAFSRQIARLEKGEFIAGKKLQSEIIRSGFSINDKKQGFNLKTLDKT